MTSKNINFLNFSNLCEKFYDVVNQNFIKYDVKDLKEHEYEIKLFTVKDFNIFNKLYNIKVDPKYLKKDSYIEVIDKQRLTTNKRRIRIPSSNIYNYVFTFANIVQIANKELWIEKTKIIEEEDDLKMFSVSYSTEEKVSHVFDFNNDSIVYFVNRIRFYNGIFITDIKLKTFLKNKYLKKTENDKPMDEYFSHFNYDRSLYLEIELNNKNLTEMPEKNKFTRDLKLMFQQIFGFLDINDIPDICSEVNYLGSRCIQTEMINIIKMSSLNYEKTLITSKIDGETMQFKIKNQKLQTIKNMCLMTLMTNVSKDYEIEGFGEYIIVDNKRCLYPFYYTKVLKNNKKIEFETRKEMLEYTNKILIDTSLSDKYTDSNGINFLVIYLINKEVYGPFETLDEYINQGKILSDKIYSYNVDGLIYMDNLNFKINETIDYKLKRHNTIDVYTKFGFIKKLKSEYLYNLNLYAVYDKIKRKYNFVNIKTFNKKQNNLLKFDYDITMPVFKQNDKNIEKIVPIVFIGEYSIEEEIIQPRYDKINKFLNTTYFGNNIKVILQSLAIHEYKLYFDNHYIEEILSKKNQIQDFITVLDKKFEEYCISINKKFKETINNPSVAIIEKVDDKIDYIKLPLNMNKNWYGNINITTKRTGLNILSNYNKTQGLLIGIGLMSNTSDEPPRRTILSIYAGKGGDISKYIHNNISEVVAIDPDANALKEYEKKAMKINKSKTKIFKLTTISLCLEDSQFITKFNKVISNKKSFDIIDIQLGLHFSLCKETEDHIMNILLYYSNKNKPKTRVFISCNDKENIENLFLRRKANKNDGIKLFLSDDKQIFYEIKYVNNEIIQVYLNTSNNEGMDEYLIDKNYLISLFEKYNFDLLSTWSFDEYCNNKFNNNEILKELAKKHTRLSTNKFLENVSEWDLTQKENEDLKEALSVLRYYIFEKRN